MRSSKKTLRILGSSQELLISPPPSLSRRKRGKKGRDQSKAGRGGGAGAAPASSSPQYLSNVVSSLSASLTRLVRREPELRKGSRAIRVQRAIRILDLIRDDLLDQAGSTPPYCWVSFVLEPRAASLVEDHIFWSGMSIGSRNRNMALLAALVTSATATDFSPNGHINAWKQIENSLGPEFIPAKKRGKTALRSWLDEAMTEPILADDPQDENP